MRTRPAHSTRPVSGFMNFENRLSSVVLPHPDGPTTATNSPSVTSSDRWRKTSTAPKLSDTSSRRSGLSLITPPDTRDSRQLEQHAIYHHADHSNHDHAPDQQTHAQAIACVPDGEAQTRATGNHLCCHNHQPRQARSDT